MGYYINSEIGYYEGDKISHLDVEVPQRPNPGDAFDGVSWHTVPLSKPKLLAALNSLYKADVANLNLAYLTALAADGVDEATRTTSIRQQITDRTTKYNIDRQAIIGGMA